MSIGRLILPLVVVWCAIHAFYYLARRKNVQLLPTNVRHGNSSHSSRNTSLALKVFHLQISTTRWNAVHDQFSTILTKPKFRGLIYLLKGLYNIGIIFGAIGMVVAMSVCAVTIVRGLDKMLQSYDYRATPESSVVRRAVDVIIKRAPLLASRRLPTLKPIIPGLTVPLSHLPIILTAVFISQIVHEFGHAIAAGVESLPMLAAGASFTICIPAAFVTFPANNNLTNQARSRVTAAGPLHNLAFWCLILSLSRLGIAHVAAFIVGYKHLSPLGKVVVDVDVNSPLRSHLVPGSIITHLDDTHLSSWDFADNWASYLTNFRPPLSLGWCADIDTFRASQTCCSPPLTSNESDSVCFTSIDDVLNRGCIDPVPLLIAQGNTTRCTSASQCLPQAESICVIPHQDTKLMRLRVRPSGSTYDHEKIILWSGSTDEVFEEVQVSDWFPRITYLPLWLPPLIQSFWEYLSMATLSLYLFNLLPLPYLDGSKLLATLLDLLFEDREDLFLYDPESLNRETRAQGRAISRFRWKGTVMKIVHFTAIGSMITCILLALLGGWG